MEKYMPNDINDDYQFIRNLRESKNSKDYDLWETRLFSWVKKLTTNDEVDPEKLAKFRSVSALLSEVPRNPYINSKILKHVYEFIRFTGYKKTCFHNFDKLRLDNSLMWDKFSEVGAPIFFESDGKKFNERFLRHLRTVSILEKNITLESDSVVVDIGGGYGQFLAMLNYRFSSTKKILVDFPEQLLVASYFLKQSFPNCRINSVRSGYEKDFSIDKALNENDFILVSTDKINLLDGVRADLVCNFSSFGEMSISNFDSYMNSKLMKNARYYFTVNRIDSFPTYNNGLSILDYKLDLYKPIHFEVSPIWDFYFDSFTPFFQSKKSFSSRNFEFLGEVSKK